MAGCNAKDGDETQVLHGGSLVRVEALSDRARQDQCSKSYVMQSPWMQTHHLGTFARSP